MKNIKNINNWPSRLNAWCNKLSHRQRLRFIIILSLIYFLLAVGVLVGIVLDESGRKKGMEIRHIIAPVPILRKGLDIVIPPDSSSYQKERNHGKRNERKEKHPAS